MDERWFLGILLFAVIVIYVDGAACGNAELETGETCDLNKLGGENCTNFNYTGGFLSCLDDCSGYDFNTCEGEEVCGNGVIGNSELCEPDNLRGRICTDEGYEGGTLKCRSDCLKYDYSGCTGNKSICGDGVISGVEECEGTKLNNKACTDFGFTDGVLSCDQCRFNKGLCVNETVEGNVTEEFGRDMNETINETGSDTDEELPSGVKGAAGDVNQYNFGLNLKYWLIILGGILLIGIALMYIFLFRAEK